MDKIINQRPIRISSWVALVKKLAPLTQDPTTQWVFRGEQKTRTPLRTTLDRLFDSFQINDKNQRISLERELIREFQRKFHHYESRYEPEDDNLIEWLSLMRHYGAPVRLLDCVYSPYIAAYFALGDPLKEPRDGWVWAINTSFCRDYCLRNLPVPRGLSEKHVDRRISSVIFRKGKRLAYPISSFRLNERLTIQQGLFLIQGSTEVPFSDNLEFIVDAGKSVLMKFLIPKSSREGIFRELRRVNITRATLFPGLDGFAQSLSAGYHVLERERNRKYLRVRLLQKNGALVQKDLR